MTIRQGEWESLKSYVKWFKVQLITFKVGLRSKEFVVALAKSPPASMTDLLMKAKKYMNAEDAFATIEVSGP